MRLRALALVVPLLLAACGAPGAAGTVQVKDREAINQLPIPEVLEGEDLTLTAQAGTSDFGQGAKASTIGLNGSYLGPTLRLQRGQKVAIDVVNNLDEMTTLHWHGMHVPAQMDGGPHSMIQPGQTWSPHWTVDQPAATLWYHSHPHGETAQQVYRGLAGMILIEDEATPEQLPDEYGVDDIPLVVQDKSFTSDGQLIVDPADGPSTGFLGDTIITNGVSGSFVPVSTEAVRLRILNASNARFYNFGFADDRQFHVVASDGGLLAGPVTTKRVQLAPAERAEVVVRLQPGETVALNSTPVVLGTTADAQYSGGTFTITELRAAPTLRASPELPAVLAQVPAADPGTSKMTRTFAVQGRAINGRPMDMHRIDMAVPVDQTEIWEISNRDIQPHNFHVHDVQFRVLSIDGQPPPPEMAGLKDTVYVAPLTTVRILLKFTDYTDRNWPYMFHCHLLLHEDLGVMGQFVVVKPGQTAGTAPSTSLDHSGMGHGG